MKRNASWSVVPHDPRPLDGGPPAPLVVDELVCCEVRGEILVAIEDARWGERDEADLPYLRALYREWSP